MDSLRKHQQNMKSMISDVSQQLGPRKGIEAVKSRDELMKVAEFNEEINPIDGSGRVNKDVGKIIKKTYQKRDGEIITKYFYVSQKNPDFKIVLCGVSDNLPHLINNPNGLVSILWTGMGRPGGSKPNDPCTSPIELQMKEHIQPEKEEVDDWWNNEITDEELDEMTGAGSAGAFVAPMGWNNDTGMSKPKNEQDLEEMTGSDSSGAYSQPAIWAKNKKNWRAVSDPNFPKYGGPGAKYVRVKEKCRKFPYCNQGDINALEFYEDKQLQETIKKVAKQTNKSEKYLKNIILQEMESRFQKDMKKYREGKMKPYKKNKNKKYTKKEIDEMIRRGFYHSPIKSLVGNVKMNKPIGQIYSMKGNKPKYE